MSSSHSLSRGRHGHRHSASTVTKQARSSDHHKSKHHRDHGHVKAKSKRHHGQSQSKHHGRHRHEHTESRGRRGGNTERKSGETKLQESTEDILATALAERARVTREVMIQVLTRGVLAMQPEMAQMGKFLRELHSRIAEVFEGCSTPEYSALHLAQLLNTQTEREVALFDSMHGCFEETKGRLCPSVKEAATKLDENTTVLTRFLFGFHPTLMDGFAEDPFEEISVFTHRDEYYARLNEQMHHWANLTKQQAMEFVDGQIPASIQVGTKLVAASKDLGMIWAKIALQFTPATMAIRLGGVSTSHQ